MTLDQLIEAHGGQSGLAAALNVDKSYINRAVRFGLKPALAVRIYRKFGHKLGPVEGANRQQIEVMERMSLRPERGQAA